MIRYAHFVKLGLPLWLALVVAAPVFGWPWTSEPAAGVQAAPTAPTAPLVQPSQPAQQVPPSQVVPGQPAAASPAPAGPAAPSASPAAPVPGAGSAQPAPLSSPAPGLPASQPKRTAAVERAPRAEAAVHAAVSYGDRVLTEDTVWRGEVLVEGALTVAPQATLTVEPGTVVRFRQKGAQAPVLVVQGRVVAMGAKDAPILFTSAFAEAAPADWQGVLLLGSEKRNVLENCRIEGAQTGLEALFSNVTLKDVVAAGAVLGMRFQDSLVVMEGGGAHGCDTGLSFTESESTLKNISVVGNRLGVTAKKSSVYLAEANVSGNQAAAFSADGCRIKIQGGAVLGNGSGVSLLGCEGTVAGAKLAKNREFGMSLTGSRIRVSGNLITGNGDNGLIVFDAGSVAWENAIYENAGYDLYNAGVEEFRAPANWWGGAVPKVSGGGGRGQVLSAPVLSARPAPQRQ